MRKIITFLGKNAFETTYRFGEQTYTSRVFPEALCQHLAFDRMYVFVTPQAKRLTYPILEALADSRIQPVDIPLGQDESVLWLLFDRLTTVVSENDQIIFDITHGLRYMPFVVFLAAAFLKQAYHIDLQAIYYGALDLRGSFTEEAPVFDLSPFVSLIDWLASTRQFLATGDASSLAKILYDEGQRRRLGVLKTLGDRLSRFSLPMMLCRPLEIMEEAGKLDRALERAAADLSLQARPFELLADRIRQEYCSRVLANPTASENTVASLQTQLDLVRWYLDNQQLMQAVTLAREWVVTSVGYRLGGVFLLAKEDREEIERGLTDVARMARPDLIGEAEELNKVGRQLLLWPECVVLQRLCNQLWNVRNDLDHAGMRLGPMGSQKLARAGEAIWSMIEELAGAWGMSES